MGGAVIMSAESRVAIVDEREGQEEGDETEGSDMCGGPTRAITDSLGASGGVVAFFGDDADTEDVPGGAMGNDEDMDIFEALPGAIILPILS
ncbi:MAG: hypothetical protein M1818_004431 [Claussenomyces sp. TS43310]|nr:MAG: hypothetical protein M1818_004431 [Claussenomyces sp. TS43310]